MPTEDELEVLDKLEIKSYQTKRENAEEEVYMPYGSFLTDSSASNFLTALWQYALEHKVKFTFDEDNAVFRMEINQNACG